MNRRLTLVVLLAVITCGLAVGIVRLHTVFIQERDDALGAIDGRQHALEQYARQELARRLSSELATKSAAIDNAADDPLLPAAEFLLVESGRQVLPRMADARADQSTQANERLAFLRTASPNDIAARVAADPTDPWSERMAIYGNLKQALTNGDRDQVATEVRNLLRHRLAYRLATRRDLPLMIATVESLIEKSTPHPSFLEQVLRDGIKSGTNTIEGLQRSLLRQRHRFSRKELDVLGGAIIEASKRGAVLHTDFVERLREGALRPVAVPDGLAGGMLVGRGAWYLEPAGNGRVRGVRAAVPSLLEEITADIRLRSLVDEKATVEATLSGPSVDPRALALKILSPEWAPAIRAVHSRYRLKTLIEVLIGGLVVGVMALLALLYRREQRFLALKEEFVSAVSHELRTPLASIRLLAETLERKTTGFEPARDYPARIVKDVDGLGFLVDNILSFNRLSRGGWDPKTQTIELVGVLQQLQEERSIWERRSTDLKLSVADDVTVEADRELLLLLFSNLLRNAGTYNDNDRPSIEVSVASTMAGVTVSVTDDGVGIPKDAQPMVFDDFYRADKTGARGSGLGLALCRKIMNAHQGTIRIGRSSATGTNTGTTFELLFPKSNAKVPIPA